VDDCFHCDRSYRTDVDAQGLRPWLWSCHPFGVGIGGSMVSL
jgi:hypothetical protein